MSRTTENGNARTSDLPLPRLTAYLRDQIDGLQSIDSVEKFGQGQSNPTYRLDTNIGTFVLRRQPSGQLLASAHAVDREFRVMQALEHTAVPVPTMLHLCSDSDVIGSQFFIMSFEAGVIHLDPSLPAVDMSERVQHYESAIDALAALHNVDIESVGLSDYGRPDNYFARQLQRWSQQYRDTETETIAPMEELMAWLERNRPADDGQSSLVHGDYCFNNIMFEATQSQVRSVLDWELSTLGHPFADLAYFCMRLRLPANRLAGGLGDASRSALGIPEEIDIVSRYCELRAIAPIEHWNTYVAFSFFRLAAICQGVAKRAQIGNASQDYAPQVGQLVLPLAQLALNCIE